MPRAAPMLSSFNAGELSPSVDGRVDVAKYASGCKVLENYVMTVQGPARRRGGTRHVAEVKDSANRTWLVPFVFSVEQAYILEFGDLYIRFYTNHGQVTSGGPAYEVVTPYTTADLESDDGTFALRLVQSNDIVYIVSQSYAPRKLSRLGATNWTLTTVTNVGGPFKTQNSTTTTVYASAATGTGITLTASASIFLSTHVGSLFYLGQKSVLSVTEWEPGKAIGAGVLRRSDGKNYLSLNAATTGGNKPVHTEGAAYDGDTGVQWEFQDPGFGYLRITAYTSGTVVTADVISRIPTNAVLVANASTRWALGAWSDAEGWPSQVTFHKERLVFGRGQNVWLSVAGDYETFTARDDGGVITADMAISITLQSDKKNNLIWFAPGDALLCGTAGAEFAIKSVTENQPFGPENVTAPEVSARGSRSIVPVFIGDVALFVQRSGLKLRDFQYDNLNLAFQSTDQNTLADHITKGGLTNLAYQQEPNSVAWSTRSDGLLLGMTYSREQYESAPYGGWHRHPIGGSFGTGNAVVESIACIPAPEKDRDELWKIVKRTIDGATVRYIEYMESEFLIGDDPQDAFFVDSGLTLNNTVAATLTPGTGANVQDAEGVIFTADASSFVVGDVGREIHYRYSEINEDDGRTLNWFMAKAVITAYTSATVVEATIAYPFPDLTAIASGGWRLSVTELSGLGHLEGETVSILADGAEHPDVVVTSGEIALDTPSSKIHVGLRCRCRLQTMRLNAGAADGTSQGKTSRINKLVIRLLETMGIKYGTSFSNMSEVDFRSTSDLMDNAVPLFTGDTIVDWPGDYDNDPWICLEQSNPQPSTIVGLMPTTSTYDRG